MSFKGTLEEFVEAIYQSPTPLPGGLVGRILSVSRSDLTIVLAIDSRDCIHLLLAPPPGEPRPFPAHAAISSAVVEWTVAGRPTQPYVDISCDAPRGSAGRRPFLSFCEDVVHELVSGGGTPDESLHRIFVRWRRFWGREPGSDFTIEWLKGLLGELVLLDRLSAISSRAGAVRGWTGPSDPDRDFQGNGIGIEVKTSASSSLLVRIHTLGQLDRGSLEKLFLVLVRLEATPQGETLSGVVRRLDESFEADADAHEMFLGKLAQAGYRRDLEAGYDRHPFQVEGLVWFRVGDDFPKVTMESFSQRLNPRIKDVAYSLNLTGLAQLGADAPEVVEAGAILCGAPS